MNIDKLLLYLIVVFSCFNQVYAQNAGVDNAQDAKTVTFKVPMEDKKVSSLLEKYMSAYPNRTQLSIALVSGNKVNYVGAIRKNDMLETIENRKFSFEIGSITKVFTSLLLASEVDLGTVSLDDPIKKYLPAPLKQSSKDGKEITLEMLANHTSGLPRVPENIIEDLKKYKEDNPYRDYDSARLKGYLKDGMKINTVPGAKTEYSNLGAGLLGYILTLRTKHTFEELLQQHIFIPLRMNNSSTILDKRTIVKGQDHLGKETSNWELRVLSGAGSIKSTAEDMAIFAQKNIKGGRSYDLIQKPTFKIDQYRQIGLGWNITNIEEDGIHVFWHNGGTGGYRSMMIVSRKAKIAVVILSNVSAYSRAAGSVDQLGREFMGMLRAK